MPLTSGAQLGPYQLLAQIGEGGMGEVWKACDTRLDRTVALKISKDEFTERFEREARAIAALNHPNICQLYDVGPNYLVMELVEGQPLKGPLPIEKAVEYASQILDALDAAHKKGIVHRDLKPANILVTRQGIKLLDFGLAKQSAAITQTDATLTKALTTEGQIAGTLQYMAPEQLHAKEADARSDIFAFGCVLYELISGNKAFQGESAASIIAAILEREPAPLQLTPPLDRVIRTCLAKDPALRFQNALDLKRALQWSLETYGSVASKSLVRWKILTGAGFFAAIVFAWAGFRSFEQTRPGVALRLLDMPPPGDAIVYGHRAGGAVISPDGRTIAYSLQEGDSFALWVRSVDGGQATLLTGTEGANSPTWSPDSKWIAYFARGDLRRVSPESGVSHVICPVESESQPFFPANSAAWTSDNRIIFTSGSRLSVVNATGGTPAVLTTPDAARGEESHRYPEEIAGGRFVYLAVNPNVQKQTLYSASLSNPVDRVALTASESGALYASVNAVGYLFWRRAGALVVQRLDASAKSLVGDVHTLSPFVSWSQTLRRVNASVSRNGLLIFDESKPEKQFTWVDRSGKAISRLGEPGVFGTYYLSPDQQRLAMMKLGLTGNDLWIVDIERGVTSRVTSETRAVGTPIWSPDGRYLIYNASADSGAGSVRVRNLYRRDIGAAGPEERISDSLFGQYPSDWSRDGRFLVYQQVAPDTRRDLWILSVSPDGRPLPDQKPAPFLVTKWDEHNAVFVPVPAPRWLAYVSDETGIPEVYVQSFPKLGKRWQVSNGGGDMPRWGPGGRELFFLSRGKLMAVDVRFGVDSVDLSSPQPLLDLPFVSDVQTETFNVSSDGRRFLLRATPPGNIKPLRVIVNWPALLSKGASQ